jgi:C1A family cysteine protease
MKWRGGEKMDENQYFHGMGWRPDYPDFRDFTVETDTLTAGQKMDRLNRGKTIKNDEVGIKAASTTLNIDKAINALPAAVDLRAYCSPVEDQKSLGSCTAQAAVGLLEYFEKRAKGTWIDASRLFVYKTTRNILGWWGDTGAYVRTTMGSLVLFGAPPERYWPYTDVKSPGPVGATHHWFDEEPGAFVYSYAQNYQALSYFRYDVPGLTTANLLSNIKAWLAAGWASMFGFTVYDSMSQAYSTGKIPLPVSGDRSVGGHAVCAVGYNDSIQIQNAKTGSPKTTGALLIRNSWGSWGGMGGYLWMPYDYVLKGLTADWWTLYNAEWIDSRNFGFP